MTATSNLEPSTARAEPRPMHDEPPEYGGALAMKTENVDPALSRGQSLDWMGKHNERRNPSSPPRDPFPLSRLALGAAAYPVARLRAGRVGVPWVPRSCRGKPAVRQGTRWTPARSSTRRSRPPARSWSSGCSSGRSDPRRSGGVKPSDVRRRSQPVGSLWRKNQSARDLSRCKDLSDEAAARGGRERGLGHPVASSATASLDGSRLPLAAASDQVTTVGPTV